MDDFHSLEIDDVTPGQPVEVGSEPKVKNKIAWFSRKSKANSEANSVALEEKEGSWRDESFGNEGSGKYRNSMPIDISLFESFDSQELKGDHVESPDLYIKTVREELEALKGFVAERRSLFSPSHSPELQVNCTDPLTAVANELVAEYSSSSESIVQPINEYSVQVPPFQTNESQSAVSSFCRQESLEYDHLEAKEDDVPQEKGCPDGFRDGGTCFVSLQYVEDSCQSEVISCDGSPQRKRSLASITEKVIQENCHVDESSTHEHSLYLLQHRERISSSIPGRLDSPSLMKSPLRHRNLQQWSSTSHIREETCHCPVCCSCRSSQRQFATSDSFEFKSGFPVQKCLAHTCNARSCPLKRYTHIVRASSILTSKSNSLQRKQSSSMFITPNIADVSERDLIGVSNGDADNISGVYSSSYLRDADSESVCSVQSQSSCCNQMLYNQGVDGSIFKERMQV